MIVCHSLMSENISGAPISKHDGDADAFIHHEGKEEDMRIKKYIEEAFAEADEFESEYGEEFECESESCEESTSI